MEFLGTAALSERLCLDSDPDPDLLRVALEFLDDRGGGGGGDGALLPNPTLAPGPQPINGDTSTMSDATLSDGSSVAIQPAGKAKKINRSRMRMRQKLEALRDEAHQLEDVVLRLQERAKARHTRTTTSALPSQESRPMPMRVASSDGGTMPCWHDTANVQFAQRRRAEAENARLRRMVNEQARVNRDMERLFRRKVNVERLLNMAMEVASTRGEPRFGSLHNWPICRELMEHLPQMYEQVDAAFEDPRFATVTSSFKDSWVNPIQPVGKTVHQVEARLIPFQVQETAAAVWKFMGAGERKQRPDYEEDSMVVNDIRIRSFVLTLQVGEDAVMRLVGHIAVRRVVETDRVVFVSSFHIQPQSISGISLDGVTIRRSEWTVVQCPQSELVRVTMDQAAAQLQFSTVTHLVAASATTTAHRHLATFDRFGPGIHHQVNDFRTNTIENSLLDGAMTG